MFSFVFSTSFHSFRQFLSLSLSLSLSSAISLKVWFYFILFCVTYHNRWALEKYWFSFHWVKATNLQSMLLFSTFFFIQWSSIFVSKTKNGNFVSYSKLNTFYLSWWYVLCWLYCANVTIKFDSTTKIRTEQKKTHAHTSRQYLLGIKVK